MVRFVLLFSLFIVYCTQNVFANSNVDPETLDANQHVIMFEKGVDAFMAGDYEKCDDYWLPLARAGDMMATRNVALLYHRGLGVQKDLEEAELFYRLAADNGITDAQTILGVLLIKGDEFDRNIPDAIKYLTAAAQAGDPVAAWNLGLLYENGIGVDKNLEKALSLFQRAARGGHEPAIMRVSGQPLDTYNTQATTEKSNKKNIDIQEEPQKENPKEIQSITPKEKDIAFDTPAEPIIIPEKTYEQKVLDDKKHDKNHFADEIHFNKNAQSDEKHKILDDDLGIYKKQEVGISQELDPFGVSSSKTNRLNEPFNTDKIGNNPRLNLADEAYNNKKYKIAQKIWQELFDASELDEAAYRLGHLYAQGKGVKKDLYQTYYYWKKGADAGGKKSSNALEDFRASLSDKQLLDYEQKIISY